MFRRKGLFWYDSQGRFFDFSSSITSNVFGYQHAYITSRIKKHLRKNSFTDFSYSCNSDFIKSKFLGWIYHYPELQHYRFFLLSDMEVYYWISGLTILFKDWEKNFDPLLSYCIKLGQNNGTGKPLSGTLITDIVSLYPDQQSNLLEKPLFLYLNSCFPNIPLPSDLTLGDNRLKGIIVGGHHPFSLGGQKLFLLNKNIEINFSPLQFSSNHWHLGIYRDIIHHHYKLMEQKGYRLREKAVKENIECIQNWAERKNMSIHILSPSPFSFRFTCIRKSKKTLESIVDSFKKNRLFYKGITIIAEEKEREIYFYFHFPVHFVPQHLKNKWKVFVDLLDKIN